MALPSLTEALDNLYTTTWQNMKSETTDQIFTATPFWAMIKKNDGLEKVEGGRFLTEPLTYAASTRIKYFGKGATFELSDQEFMTVATEEWRYVGDSIVRFAIDDQKNRGKNQIINFMKAKLELSKQSLIDEMEKALFRAAPSALQFQSLPKIVSTTPSSGTIHGIDPATYTWWRNTATTLTGLSFIAQGEAKMMTMLNTLLRNDGSKKEDYIIITDQTTHELYEQGVGELRRLVNQNIGDAGFDRISYKGVPVDWSPQATAQVMYFLNTKMIKFKYDPMMWFDMTDWKPIPDSLDRAAQVPAAGNLMTRSRRSHGCLYAIDTP